MTRNHEREPYALAAVARVHGAIARQGPIEWARSIHTQKMSGELRYRKEVCDTAKTVAKVRGTTKPELAESALKTIARGENELRLRALIRATRLLGASKHAADRKMAKELSEFLARVWGVQRAYEAVSEGDAELYDQLREKWGEVQLPPEGATVAMFSADELLVQAAVRRLG